MTLEAQQTLRPEVDPLSGGPAFDPTYYQYERYRGEPRRSPALTAYYALKPFIPRKVQLRARRRYAKRQAQRDFPAWPIEPLLVDHLEARLGTMLASGSTERVPFVGFWPEPWRSACILTHDVEGPRGIERIDAVLQLEQQYGLRSCWNFVAEDYSIPAGTFERLRDAGCEIGLHGIHHDGKLFQSRRRFLDAVPKIHDYLDRWGAVGFRSPATHRRADWMHELGALYDSSYPDTDPFEPQPGGCCSILPFMFGDVVELPITLIQDHTVWELMRLSAVEIWTHKATWIARHHGLVNINTHPDYFTSDDRLRDYAAFLRFMRTQPHCWHALPREVAAWWKQRARIECDTTHETPCLIGDADCAATIWWASSNGDGIKFHVGGSR